MDLDFLEKTGSGKGSNYPPQADKESVFIRPTRVIRVLKIIFD
jgi:hypothetical protein